MIRVATAALIALSAAGLGARAALASSEEFSTFEVAILEEDDESLLDHLLTRPPREWRASWERSIQGFRNNQGCLTSGTWFLENELRVRAPAGKAQFGVDLVQHEADDARFQHLDLLLRVPTRWGTPSLRFRPVFDKSRHDVLFGWDVGADTAAFLTALTFGVEDAFNNLWAQRQAQVGELSEPYEKHPFEPAVRLQTRGDGWRAHLGGRYLTPSRKRVVDLAAAGSHRVETLWGTLAEASVEARALGCEWSVTGINKQARETDRAAASPDSMNVHFRRQWRVEGSVSRSLGPRWVAELSALYQDRSRQIASASGTTRFDALDRLVRLETRYMPRPELRLTLGAMRDRIGIWQSGASPVFTYGTRFETRAYLGVGFEVGRLLVNIVEGFELDSEPYPVVLVHDKGFIQFQTAF